MNSPMLIAISVIVAIAAVSVALYLFIPPKTTVIHPAMRVSPGNISYSSSACPALINGEVDSVISTFSTSGFSVYNVSGYRDYVIPPGRSGSITVDVTREIVGGTANQYTNTSLMNITDTGGFGLYSASAQTIPENVYDTLIPYPDITNVTGNYCVSGSGSACNIAGPVIIGFSEIGPIQASCGRGTFNISLGDSLSTTVKLNNLTAYVYLTEKNGSLIRSDLILSSLSNKTLYPGEIEQVSFTGNACGGSTKNYTFYASINYSLIGSNLTSLSSGEIKGVTPSYTFNGFESKLMIPALAATRQMPIIVNFSGGIPSNISEFLKDQSGMNVSISSVLNSSGTVNATFLLGLPIYILHPGVTTSVEPESSELSVNQSSTFNTTFNTTANATEGTYWIYPKVSGQFPCSYQYYALLTIGSAPYNGSLNIVRFA